MTHLDAELQSLKSELIGMWSLVNSQLIKAKEALMNFDKDLAREVVANEKRVNAYELKLDRDCENIFALFNPVAVDLRFVLAVLKINNNLERMGDNAESIAKYVLSLDSPLEQKLPNDIQILKMYDTAINMMLDVTEAFDKEDSKLARNMFKEDETLDVLNTKATTITAEYIKANLDKIYQSVYLLSIFRKLERVEDQAKNIAEEIIFYIEAKVLKHGKKNMP